MELKIIKDIVVKASTQTIKLVTYNDKEFSLSGFAKFERAKDMLLSLHYGEAAPPQKSGGGGKGKKIVYLKIHKFG